MSRLEDELRELVREIVRAELGNLGRKPSGAAEQVYLTTADAAEMAQVAQGTIRRWIREGRLTPHRAGRELRVARVDLERLLREGQAVGDGALSPEEMARRDFG